MAKAKITIIGTVEREPKYNQDGTIDLLFKGSMSLTAPKGLKSLGDSYYIVHVGPKTWKKVSDTFKEDSCLIVQGEPKASKNSKDVPFIEVVCFDISIRDQKKESDTVPDTPVKTEPAAFKKNPETLNTEAKNDVKDENSVPVSGYSKEDNKKMPERKRIVWYSPDEMFEINVADVIITDKTHLATKNINFHGLLKICSDTGRLNNPIAVKPLDNGKYALVMGIKYLIIAKILNFPTIYAVKRDMEHEELTDKLGIKER